MRYVFSGNMPSKAPEILMRDPDFKPVSLLCTQLERSEFEKYNKFRSEGFCDFIMVDSGAYSVFTGKATTTVDQYVDFINKNKDRAEVFVELDTIPGEWRKSKKPEHYVKSAEESWKTFLYMRDRVSCPDKLMPIFHSGESYCALSRILDWRDERGNALSYIGISAAKDASNKNRDTYLADVRKTVEASRNPNVRMHLFGTTALKVLSSVKCESCDSTTHVRVAAVGSVISPSFGVISVSSKGGVRGARRPHFLQTASSANINVLKSELEPLKLTVKDIAESAAARCAFNMHSILKLVSTTYRYHDCNVVRRKTLV